MRALRSRPFDSLETSLVCRTALAGALVCLFALPLSAPAQAQALMSKTAPDASKEMMVDAGQLNYDSKNETVILTGHVQIFYQGRTLEADKVTYNKKTKRLHAIGNVRQTEPNGNIAYAREIDFDDGFTTGFARVINVETPDRLRVAGALVTREKVGDDQQTVIHKGVYTAHEPSPGHPERAPLWQIKAEKIVHSENDQRLYFDNARMELWGFPIIYTPYLSVPDWTVRKASGFMSPNAGFSDRLGLSTELTYFWNIAPNYDMTIGLNAYSRQGVMPRLEWRHGMENGSYAIRGAGLFQGDPNQFAGEPGQRSFRGYLNTEGSFNVAKDWAFGWNIYAFSDATFLRDYPLLPANTSEANSTVYLQGSKATSFFDMRFTKYQGITSADDNNRQAFTHPALDYFKASPDPVLGGQLTWRVNAVALTRLQADFTNRSNVDCSVAANVSSTNCMLQGIQGTYSRISAEVNWRKRMTDAIGQVWEPYLGVRGDIGGYSTTTPLQSPTFTGYETQATARIMPTVGLTYRYPWLAAHSWGTSVIEPIVQLVARPNEMSIGNLPNEDSQSLVFDDTNLFAWNKFSGNDRVEGGGRANYALQYTARAASGQSASLMIGQSRQLFGLNSFAMGTLDPTSTGLNSGLDTTASDYISRLAVQPMKDTRFTVRSRFDQATFTLQRGELEATTLYDRASLTAFASYFAPQPQLGYLVPRAGVGGAVSWRFADYWTVYGSLRYAFVRPASAGSSVALNNMIDGWSLGLSYLDEGSQFSFFYIRDAQGLGLPDITRYMFRYNLRTLGEAAAASL